MQEAGVPHPDAGAGTYRSRRATAASTAARITAAAAASTGPIHRASTRPSAPTTTVEGHRRPARCRAVAPRSPRPGRRGSGSGRRTRPRSRGLVGPGQRCRCPENRPGSRTRRRARRVPGPPLGTGPHQDPQTLTTVTRRAAGTRTTRPCRSRPTSDGKRGPFPAGNSVRPVTSRGPAVARLAAGSVAPPPGVRAAQATSRLDASNRPTARTEGSTRRSCRSGSAPAHIAG
jgi:hypothetical protein